MKHYVGVVAPSFSLQHVKESDLARGVEVLLNEGIQVKFSPECFAKDSGSRSAAVKAEAFSRLALDPEIDAIICAFGGHNAVAILNFLDLAVVAGSYKPVVGYSDCTSIVNAVYQAGGRGIHGPSFVSFCEPDNGPEALLQLMPLLSGQIDLKLASPSHYWDDPWYLRSVGEGSRVYRRRHSGLQVLREGSGRAVVEGGNVDSILAYMDTGYPFPFASNVILLVETPDDGGPQRFMEVLLRLLKRIDQTRVDGIIIGQFGDHWHEDFDIFEGIFHVVSSAHPGSDYPVVWNASVSHTRPMQPIELGSMITLDTANCFTRASEKRNYGNNV